MRERHDYYHDRIDGSDSDQLGRCRTRPMKRTRVQGNKKRIITSTEDAADPPTKGVTIISPRGLGDDGFLDSGRYRGRTRRDDHTRSKPTYPKIRREYIDERTLAYYDLPWETSRDDPDSIVILREMSGHECEILFEHTKRLQTAYHLLEKSPDRVIRRPPPPQRRGYDPYSRSSPARSASEQSRRRRRRSLSSGELLDRRAEVIEVIEDHDVERRRVREEDRDVERRKIREEAERFEAEVRLREERARQEAKARRSGSEEEEDDESASDDGSDGDFDLSFLPSMYTNDSTDNDIGSNASTNVLLLPGNRLDHATRHGPYHEKHILSTKWSGNTFDDSSFGAEIITMSSPPIKSHKPMLRWVHLDRSMPSFEEFSSVAQEVLDVAAKDKRHIRDVLRRLQRTNEQQRQQGRDMKPFCEADVDIEQRGSQVQKTSSICVLSIPFFCLEKTMANQLKSLASGSPEQPSRPLVQSHTRMVNETRELAQAVSTLRSTPEGHYLHISQLWCLLVNDDTLVTCSKFPISELGKDLSFTETAEKASEAYLRLRAGHTRRWHLPAAVARSLPAFLSMVTDRISNVVGSNPEAEMKYHGKPVRFRGWIGLLDDAFRTRDEIVIASRCADEGRSSRSRVLQHLRSVTGHQTASKTQSTDGQPPADIAGVPPAPLSTDIGEPTGFTFDTADYMMIFLHGSAGSSKALADLASSLHQTLCSAQHKVTRQSYIECPESQRLEVEAWLKEEPPAEVGRPRTSQRAKALKEQKFLIARLAMYIFGFFWPKDFDHVATRKFWGALHEVLTGETFFGSGAVDKARDLEMTRDLLRAIVDDLFEFVYSFTTTFADHEADLHALPQQFYKAWLYFVSTFTIAAKTKLKYTYDDNWNQPNNQIRSVKEALQEGGLLLSMRLRKNGIEEFEVCSSRGIIALMLDCLTRDLMNGKPDVPQTYSDYCRRLEAKIVAEPLSRSHQETLRALQQEIEAIIAVLAQQLEVVTYFESSVRDLDCGERVPDLPMLRDSRQDLVLRQCKATISSRIDQFEALQGRATELGEWHMGEIDTNKDRQEAAIMVFTIVTIVFLPLSFVSSVFGMNTEDIRDMTQGQWAYWAAAVPLTFVVVGLSLWFAGAFDNNVKSWFTRSSATSGIGPHRSPAARMSEVKPRLYDDTPVMYPGVRRRTTYPTKRSYA